MSKFNELDRQDIEIISCKSCQKKNHEILGQDLQDEQDDNKSCNSC